MLKIKCTSIATFVWNKLSNDNKRFPLFNGHDKTVLEWGRGASHKYLFMCVNVLYIVQGAFKKQKQCSSSKI